MLFLKYRDDLEKDKQTAAELSGKSYSKIIDEEFQWSYWAALKLENGKIAHNALIGDDLADFVNIELFLYLKKFNVNADNANTLAENLSDIQEKDHYNIVLANPPFGGNQRNLVLST